MSVVNFSALYIPDPTKGRPVFNGQIYIGLPDLDPKIPANQKDVYYVLETGGLVLAQQPIATSAGGVPVYNGSYVTLDVSGNYSMRVDDSKDVQVYYLPNNVPGSDSNGTIISINDPETLADAQLIVNFSSASMSGAAIYIGKDSGDRGRLFPVKDYDVTGEQQITLTQSYPAGTICLAVVSEYTNIAAGYVKKSTLLEGAINDTSLVEFDTIEVRERTLGNGGGGLWNAVDVSTVIVNGFDIVQCVGNPLLALVVSKEQGLTKPPELGATGDGVTIDILPIQGSNDTLGNTVELFNKTYAIDETLKLNRYSSLTSLDNQSWPNSVVLWAGAIDTPIIKTEPNQTIKGVTIDGDSVAGVTGLEIGDDTAFDAYLKYERLWIKNNDVGIRASNCFDVNIEQIRVADNRLGIHIDPVAFPGDGGYTTTFRIKNSYITDNDEQGLLDSALIQNKMFTVQDSVFEKNGDATHAQIEMLNGGQVNYLTGLYIEDATSLIPAVKYNSGVLRDMYFNGYSVGVDLGSSGSRVHLENILFASSNATPVSVTSSGGANAVYCSMKLCSFDGAPTLDSRIQIFDGCTGDLPVGIPENSWVMTGAKPQHGIGTTPAITRDIEAWLESDAGTTILANSVYRFTITIPVGRMSDGLTALSVTPQSDLTDGLSVSVARVNTITARVTISNPTTSSIILAATDYLLRMEQFAAINN